MFCIPLSLLAFGADRLISNNLKKSNTEAQGEYTVWNDIYAGKINADIAIYGASRAWIDIDPDMFSRAFKIPTYNLGIDGQTFGLQYFRNSLLLKYNHTPKIIIQALDIMTLTRSYNPYNFEQFLPYMLFNNSIRNATKSYDLFNIFDFVIPAIRYMGRRQIIDNAFTSLYTIPVNPKYRINGYRGSDQQWNDDLEKAKAKIGSFKVQLDAGTVSLFEKYLIECKEKNIKVILVYPPEYIDGQRFTENRDKIMKLYKSFGLKYHIPFYDFSNDSISYQKKYFYNTEHLNKTGAELFTQKLIKDLQENGNITSTFSKAYPGELTKVWVAENARFNITSNTISPSFMQTSLTAGIDERVVEQIKESHPLKKLLTVDEVAKTVAFLVNASSQINAIDILMNGGANIQ
jgi:hypothetical protein